MFVLVFIYILCTNEIADTINTNCKRKRAHQEKTYTQKRRSSCSHFYHFRSFNGFSVLRNLLLLTSRFLRATFLCSRFYFYFCQSSHCINANF